MTQNAQYILFTYLLAPRLRKGVKMKTHVKIEKGTKMAKCWELRGCDEEMQSRCPHNIPNERCPADCHFAACGRKTHVVTQNIDLLFRLDVDRSKCVKDICQFCEFFLTNGPTLDTSK